MSSQKHSFLHHYQQLLFSEKNADVFEKCSIRRKCIAQMFKTSVSLSNNFTTCILFERNLHKYLEIVNDKSSVNNYAEAIKTLLSCSRAECNMWKSSLCSNTMMSQNVSCNSTRTDESDLEFLIGAWKEEKNLIKVDGNTSNCIGHKNEEKLPFSMRTSKTSTPCPLEEQKRQIHPSTVKEGAKSNSSSFGLNCVQSSGKYTVDTNITSAYLNQFSGSRTKPSSNLMNAPTSYSYRGSNSSLSPNHTNDLFSHSSKEANINNNHSVQRSFRTGRDELVAQNNKKWSSRHTRSGAECGVVRKFLGSTRRNVMNKFIPPVKNSDGDSCSMLNQPNASKQDNEVEDERLKNIDPKMIESIQNEIMDHGAPVHWDDIAGLQYAKNTIQEIVVWPMLRPEIFTGLRRPPKGILLFGPPGTGKTLIGKCIASQSRSTFFSISASSLTSKWIGDGEKMVRALFAVARCHQPAVVFIDEIDSLLCQRSDTEHESSRRIKTEFLVQLDGATTAEEDRILVVGATNRPQELDEAARRRMVKRLYIPLPDHKARYQIVERLMSKEQNSLTSEQVNEIALLTEGYSGADVRSLCEEASMGPIRSISFTDIENISPDEVRPISFADFKGALKRVRASVSSCDLQVYQKWNQIYGCN